MPKRLGVFILLVLTACGGPYDGDGEGSFLCGYTSPVFPDTVAIGTSVIVRAPTVEPICDHGPHSVQWTSSDPSVLELSPANTAGIATLLTGVRAGTARVRLLIRYPGFVPEVIADFTSADIVVR